MRPMKCRLFKKLYKVVDTEVTNFLFYIEITLTLTLTLIGGKPLDSLVYLNAKIKCSFFPLFFNHKT